MGLAISTQRADDNRPVRLNREAFFATGATVDHGDHLHEFAIAGEQAIVRNLQRQDAGETVTASEQTMSLDDAFALYTLLSSADNLDPNMAKLALIMALAAALAEEEAELSAESSDTEELAAQGSDADEPTEDEEESTTPSPTM
ncbi:hypothetical protein [Legionella shakespearei]|uniref:Uncharacterized protein n=1 Tax=Legionella shakespearei DSM 23087 TaxID=1122169 RepID=A0A0W0Z5F1_9GAMM|nr:hypothetical protein [Legionella shakespearei]KTD64158.1 hypothetical protein Lsha_0589 [Legionella shakespearei DSM 23087]